MLAEIKGLLNTHEWNEDKRQRDWCRETKTLTVSVAFIEAQVPMMFTLHWEVIHLTSLLPRTFSH